MKIYRVDIYKIKVIKKLCRVPKLQKIECRKNTNFFRSHLLMELFLSTGSTNLRRNLQKFRWKTRNEWEEVEIVIAIFRSRQISQQLVKASDWKSVHCIRRRELKEKYKKSKNYWDSEAKSNIIKATKYQICLVNLHFQKAKKTKNSLKKWQGKK